MPIRLSLHPSLMRHISALLASLILSVAALSCIAEDDLTNDQRAYQLSQQLMCPICDGQTLDQSQAQISQDMKSVIQEKLESGESNAEIRDYFVERYGEAVLAAPSSSGFNLIAWVMPMLIFGGGLGILSHTLIKMRRNSVTENPEAVSDAIADQHSISEANQNDDDLVPYLERVEHELATFMPRRPGRNKMENVE